MASRFSRRRIGKIVSGGALFLLSAIVVSALIEHVLEVRDAARLTASDTFFQVQGRRVRYRLLGAGKPGPAIVLVTGLGGSLEQWDTVQRGLSANAPVLAYDRTGMGFSDATREHDAVAQADELAGLLNAPELSPPFVIVSYSLSAMLARVFASRHPDLVGALVFLDPTVPALQPATTPKAQLTFKRVYMRGAVSTTLKALVGYLRFKQFIRYRHDPPTGVEEKERAIVESFHHWLALAGDALALDRSSQEAEETPGFGRGPVAVLSTIDPLETEAEPAAAYQRNLAAKSSCGTFQSAPKLPHTTLLSDPNGSRAVTAFIRDFGRGACPHN